MLHSLGSTSFPLSTAVQEISHPSSTSVSMATQRGKSFFSGPVTAPLLSLLYSFLFVQCAAQCGACCSSSSTSNMFDYECNFYNLSCQITRSFILFFVATWEYKCEWISSPTRENCVTVHFWLQIQPLSLYIPEGIGTAQTERLCSALEGGRWLQIRDEIWAPPPAWMLTPPRMTRLQSNICLLLKQNNTADEVVTSTILGKTTYVN